MNSNMLKKCLAVFIIIFNIPLFFVGCFNYNDINTVTFPTSMIFDVDDLGQTIVYLDCIKPYRSANDSSDKGRRIIYKGIGKSVPDALSDITRVSSYKLNYSQTRAYIFTERAAKVSVKRFLDLINSNSEFQLKPSTFVYYGDVKELLKITSSDEEYLGLFLNDLVVKNKENPRAMNSNINYYLSNSLLGSNTTLLTSITLKEDALDKKVEIDGASILKDSMLVDKMEVEDNLIYNLMMNNVNNGNLDVANPDTENSFVTLEIKSSNVTNSLTKENDQYILNKNIYIEAAISDIQGSLTFDEEVIKYIKDNKEAYLNGYGEYLFNKYKEKGLDIFNVTRMLEVYYPKEEVVDPISKTTLKVNTELKIIGGGTIKNSL